MTLIAQVGLTLSTFAILMTSILLATTGQVLLKTGMERVGELSVGEIGTLLGQFFTTWQLVVGMGAFGMSSIFWLIVLSRVPLSTAYPIVSLSYVLILTFSWFVLGERPSVIVWVGSFLIMAGVSLIGIGQR